MDIGGIVIKARNEGENLRIREGIEKLPEDTIKGISTHGQFSAMTLADGTVKMGDFNNDVKRRDKISVTAPEEAEKVIYSNRKASFLYHGTRYEIYFG